MFRDLRTFLIPYIDIANSCVLRDYPRHLNKFDGEWVEFLTDLDPMEAWTVTEHRAWTGAPASLSRFAATIESFNANVPFVHQQPSQNYQYMKPKKCHEVSQIVPLVAKEMGGGGRCGHVVDVGGGRGLLAHALTETLPHTIHSVDQDAAMQIWGQKTFSNNRLKFLNFKLSGSNLKQLRSCVESRSYWVGLHTCGALSLDLWRLANDSQYIGLLNIPCCYHGLGKKDLNLSPFGRSNPLALDEFGLFLAARGRRDIPFKQFELLRTVFLYKSALTLYLKFEYGLNVVKFGSAKPSLYAESFEDYAQDRLGHLNRPELFNRKRVRQFFLDQNSQRRIQEMFGTQLIRNTLARALELDIVLDRADYFAEGGARVRVAQIFDPQLSPRNLAILVNAVI